MAAKNLKCNYFNIKNAFIKASLKERIYLSKPPGIPMRDGYVFRIFYSLYGLKQSARD